MANELEVFFEIHSDLPREAPGGNQYTCKAYQMLPELEAPRILDVGCGPGEQTLELARLSRGQVTAIDVHQPYLDRLSKRIEQADLSGRVQALNCSMFEIAFPDESFDVIWAEGSIYIIGFDRGLDEWRRLIKPDGFLVAHDLAWLGSDPPKEIEGYWREFYPGMRSVPENMRQIEARGYHPIGWFALPDDAWWANYYDPLGARIARLREKYGEEEAALRVLDSEEREIDMFRRYHEWYGAVFFIMQKTGGG